MFLTGPGKNMTKGDVTTVYVLGTAVKSGETISLANVATKIMGVQDIPADAVSISQDVVAKIDLTPGTILTAGMLNLPDEAKVTNDLREQEYNMISLPTNLNMGDFIDIRLQLPNGGDYIVVSKKKVLNCNASTIWLEMYEEEIELMSNAIIEYYIMAGSKLYATTYTDPGTQAAATPTYCPSAEVADLISGNANITAIVDSRYTEKLKSMRNNRINAQINKYSDTKLENIETKIQQEIKNLQQSREAYFGALNAAK